MSYLCTAIEKSSMRPDGGIGRRAGLKHQWIHFHPGSTPGLGTKNEVVSKRWHNLFYILQFCYIFWINVRIWDQRKNLRDFHFMHII